MRGDTPILTVVAGPNGSGKSTLTARGLTGDFPVIDPDAIAREINFEDTASAAVAAGREALKRQNDYLKRGESFAIETTLSGRASLNLMENASQAGFYVQLEYIRVDTPEANIDRIEQRVASGGHHVPDQDVTRRYQRSLVNIPVAIGLADHTNLYNNSADEVVIVAELSRNRFTFYDETPLWAAQASYEGAKHYLKQATTAQERVEAILRQTEAETLRQELEKLLLKSDHTLDLGDDFGL